MRDSNSIFVTGALSIAAQKALLVGLTCLIGFWLAAYFHLQDPFWSLLTILILLSEPTVHPIYKGVLRTIGTLVGILFAVGLLAFVSNDKIILSFSLIISITLINYLGFRSEHQYSFFYAGLTFYLVYMVHALQPAELEHFIAWRIAEICLGVLLTIMASLFMPYEHAPAKLKSTHLWKLSFKIAVNAYLSFLLCLWIGWYGAIPGLVSAYIITATSSQGGAKKKTVQRFLGCFAGGCIGLSYLVFFEQTYLSMSIYIFLSLSTLAYGCFQISEWRYAYLQAAVAFCITIVSNEASTIDNIHPALERLAGILLGGLVALFVNQILFPEAHQNK